MFLFKLRCLLFYYLLEEIRLWVITFRICKMFDNYLHTTLLENLHKLVFFCKKFYHFKWRNIQKNTGLFRGQGCQLNQIEFTDKYLKSPKNVRTNAFFHWHILCTKLFDPAIADSFGQLVELYQKYRLGKLAVFLINFLTLFIIIKV